MLFVSDIRINPLNAELNPILHLLAMVVARHIVHVSMIRVNCKVQSRPTYAGQNGKNYRRFGESASFIIHVVYWEYERIKNVYGNDLC